MLEDYYAEMLGENDVEGSLPQDCGGSEEKYNEAHQNLRRLEDWYASHNEPSENSHWDNFDYSRSSLA